MIVLAPRIRADVVFERAGDADQIDAVVLVEALILDRDEGLRHVAGSDDIGTLCALATDIANERAVAGEDERRLRLVDDPPGLVSA